MIKDLFHIIRWPNLLLLAGIQVLVFYKLINHFDSVLSTMDLVILIMITVLIGAGGYVINDYYDTGIDKINKPGRWIAGNKVPLNTVKILYISLVSVGLALSIWLSIRLGMMRFLFIYPVAVIGLWLYSHKMKCMPFLGNSWVAFFCAGVIAIIALPDLIMSNPVLKPELWWYVIFAFISTWMREIIKDMEDMEGDSNAGCQTAIVRFGIKSGNITAVVVGLALIASLVFWETDQRDPWIKLILTILQGFVAGSIAFVLWAKSKKYYSYASAILKFVMVGGTFILFML